MTTPIIQLEKVGKKHGETPVLEGIGLSLEDGGKYILTGRSGAGKSTLLHIMGALDFRHTGDYRFNGTLIEKTEKARGAVRSKFGFMHQDLRLLPHLTVEENIVLPLVGTGRNLDMKEVPDPLRTRICKWRSRLPCELSRGERQFAALARAMVTGPTALFVDEPTASLSNVDRPAIWKCLADFNGLVVVVTHEDGPAAFSKTNLAAGKIVP